MPSCEDMNKMAESIDKQAKLKKYIIMRIEATERYLKSVKQDVMLPTLKLHYVKGDLLEVIVQIADTLHNIELDKLPDEDEMEVK